MDEDNTGPRYDDRDGLSRRRRLRAIGIDPDQSVDTVVSSVEDSAYAEEAEQKPD